MSRYQPSRNQPTQSAERTSQNQQTLKTLVKVESNKSCADCKRNKHPRWASWNLGVFICIRCSGIHRGMGTHISRVKSVDLDAWTDEQMQSILKWGNARANKYWESKLTPGHVPAENKIENFIRTKYESRRWVMEGPMPDPSTLDVEGDDEVPLNVVQEKAKLDRSSSQRTSSAPNPAPLPQPRAPPQQQVNLFDDDPPSAPPAPRPASVATPGTRAPPPQQTSSQATKQNQKGGDSLLGFDFFGPSSSNPPPRPSSAAASTPGTSSGPSRPDLKQSILSLYAAKPQPPPQPQQQQHQRSDSGAQQSGSGLDDAFAGLSFSSGQSAPPPKPSPFADLTSPTSPPARSRPSIGGGNFFSPKPAQPNPPPVQAPRAERAPSISDDFGDFTSMTPSSTSAPPPKPTTSKGNGLSNDLFDLSEPAPAPPPATNAKPLPRNPPPITSTGFDSSPFNLSAQTPKPPPTQTKPMPPMPQAQPAKPVQAPTGLEDPWGSSDVWATNNAPAPAAASPPAPAPAPKAAPAAPTMSMSDDFGGWGSSATPAPPAPPKVTADEDFGGWEQGATPTATTSAQPPMGSSNKPPGGGFGGSEDLFSNVWE